MNPDVATALMLIVIGVVIVLTAFAPRHVPWPSEVEYYDDDIAYAYFASIEPVTERMIPFDEAEKRANGCPDPEQYQ